MTTDKKYDINKYVEDAMASKYEVKAERMIKRELEDGTLLIGKSRYDALKKKPASHLLSSEKKQIKTFEDHHGITAYILKTEKLKTEREQRIEDSKHKLNNIIKSINKKSVWNLFKKTYKKHYNVNFEQTTETLENIAPIIKYFSKDESFLEHGVKDSSGNFLSIPSLDKGLCIVGGFGNGKTSIMNTMQRLFIGIPNYSFGRFSSHEIVQKYEEASKHKHPEVLENFWNMLTRSELYIDDVKAESLASAYGKKNILNSLFQERYNKNQKTHISINYAKGENGNVPAALFEFKEKYSDQVYDRIYQMYNIIEFKGKSFRR